MPPLRCEISLLSCPQYNQNNKDNIDDDAAESGLSDMPAGAQLNTRDSPLGAERPVATVTLAESDIGGVGCVKRRRHASAHGTLTLD